MDALWIKITCGILAAVCLLFMTGFAIQADWPAATFFLFVGWLPLWWFKTQDVLILFETPSGDHEEAEIDDDSDGDAWKRGSRDDG